MCDISVLTSLWRVSWGLVSRTQLQEAAFQVFVVEVAVVSDGSLLNQSPFALRR